ncbi:unnamed protein product [Brassica oleracea var. botrytis]
MEENLGNGREDLGKSLLVENKGIRDDPSLNGTPLMKPTLLEQDGLPIFQDAYNQTSVAMATTQPSLAMATSQASAQSHGVYAATLTQGQRYQQPYQHYYQNYVGDYMQQQQPMQLQSFDPQNQVI